MLEHVPEFDPRVRRLLFGLQVTSALLPPHRQRGTPDLRSCQAWLTNSTHTRGCRGVIDVVGGVLSLFFAVKKQNNWIKKVLHQCKRSPTVF